MASSARRRASQMQIKNGAYSAQPIDSRGGVRSGGPGQAHSEKEITLQQCRLRIREYRSFFRSPIGHPLDRQRPIPQSATTMVARGFGGLAASSEATKASQKDLLGEMEIVCR